MDDLQICKNIAEIEGHKTLPWDEYQEGDFYIVIDDHGEGYNPLTDRALLNDLIFKYEVSISFNSCLISIITDKQYEMSFTDIPSLKRNCLLLIIEAHK